MNKISILNFATAVKEYIVNSNEKYIKWGPENDVPKHILSLYNNVPEHESAINFLETNTTGIGLNVEDLDIWTIKKIVLDYFLFGGFSIKITKLRNGTYKYEHLDIAKTRLNIKKDKVGYAEDWSKYKVELTWYDLVTKLDQVKNEAIFYFKNNKSREAYPRPHYLSAFQSIDTASAIARYHNTNAHNGFTPSAVINFNNGVPDEETKAEIEKQIREKFTGPDGQKFILSFQDTADNAVTISKLENDNLDQKFETLQKWVQNQILITHQITSGQLIGVKAENQGFSQTEFQESLDVFKSTVINGYRQELEYALGLLLNKEIKILDEDGTTNIPTNAGE